MYNASGQSQVYLFDCNCTEHFSQQGQSQVTALVQIPATSWMYLSLDSPAGTDNLESILAFCWDRKELKGYDSQY